MRYPLSTASPLSPAWFVLPAAATMIAVVRLGFGGWFWDVQVWVFLALLVMAVITLLIRGFGKRFDPEVGSSIMLAGNFARMAVVLMAMLAADKLIPENFPAFCASTMIGYMYYLLAEIYELVLTSRRD